MSRRCLQRSSSPRRCWRPPLGSVEFSSLRRFSGWADSPIRDVYRDGGACNLYANYVFLESDLGSVTHMSAALLLSMIVFLPAVATLVIALIPSEQKEAIRWATLIVTAIVMALV